MPQKLPRKPVAHNQNKEEQELKNDELVLDLFDAEVRLPEITPKAPPASVFPSPNKVKVWPTGGKKPRINPKGVSSIMLGADGFRPRQIVTLETRDLSAKKGVPRIALAALAKWHGSSRGQMLDAYMKSQAEAARRKFGHSAVSVGNASDQLLVGIPCPLAFEYLIGQDAFLLGLIYQIVGKPGSLKSALLYEIFRWIRNAGGGSHLEEVETKYSRELLQSIVGYGADETNVLVQKCDSVEDFQRKIMYDIEQEKKFMTGTTKEPGPGKTFPVCFGVDSVSGKLSIETQERIDKQGYHGRAHPVEALSITGFMKRIPSLIDDFPFVVVLNNHLKMGQDENGHEKRTVTGGSGINFQESFELETKVRKSQIACADWDGVEISIRCMKSSFGPTHREIRARMLWWEELGESGDYQQVTRWDWNWSLINLLINLKGRAAVRLKEAGVHIEAPKVSDVENSAWSRNLGHKSAVDAVPWSKLGEMISANLRLTDTIRQCLAIRRRPLLDGDYLQQLESLRTQLP